MDEVHIDCVIEEEDFKSSNFLKKSNNSTSMQCLHWDLKQWLILILNEDD